MHLCRVRSLLLLVTLVGAVAAVGCGEGTLASPTAPSALSASTTLGVDASTESLAPAEDQLVASGGSKSKGGNSGSGKDKNDSENVGDSSAPEDNGKGDKSKGGKGKADVGVAVEEEEEAEDAEDAEDNYGRRRNLSGFVTEVGTDSITIRGITVKITDTTVIRHGHRELELADIAVGDHAQAKGMMSEDGTTLTASEIKVEDTGKDNDDEDTEDASGPDEVVGIISGLGSTATCPVLTFTIGTITVNTGGGSGTTFIGVACNALANGTEVEVEGTLSGTTLAASSVKLK